jgi:hypothetical protein
MAAMLVGSSCNVAAAFVVAKKNCLKPSDFLVLYLVPGIACRPSILFFGLPVNLKNFSAFLHSPFLQQQQQLLLLLMMMLWS